MNKFFELPFTVQALDSDASKKLRLNFMLDYFQELAYRHAEVLGFGYEQLQSRGLYWVLSRLAVEISSLPKWKDALAGRTWAKGTDKLFALRDYQLLFSDGAFSAAAESAWLLVDADKNRPVRPEAAVGSGSVFNPLDALASRPAKLEIPAELPSEYSHRVKYSDIDLNAHVNNTRYMEWMLDILGLEFLAAHEPAGFQINFISGAKYGEEIIVSYKQGAAEAFFSGREKISSRLIFNSVMYFK
jgi:acyl-ACP thioesterase